MSKRLIVLLVLLLVVAVIAPAGAALGAANEGSGDLIPVDIDPLLKGRPAPQQPTPAEATVTARTTSESRCFGDGTTLTITTSSFDPANPGTQDVVFSKETATGSGGKATLWVAWDFLAASYGDPDVITCEQLAYLQGTMDAIVATDVEYFGQYTLRPDDNENIDVMIYNIVDESYYDPEVAFYVAGYFWSSVNEVFDRNMVFIDSYDWANRLGPDVAHPYAYEGTVAHELEHLIHNDWDPSEMSWVDEGLADLAQYVNGFGHDDGHVVYFLAYHRTSLTQWGGGLESYGASYLFQLYLAEQFGSPDLMDGMFAFDPNWTVGLVAEQADSIAGIEAQTGAEFNDLFDSWILANYLDDPLLDGAGGFPLGYDTIDLVPYVTPSGAYSPWSISRSIKSIYGGDHHGNLPTSRYYGGYMSGTVEYPIGDLPPYAAAYGTYKGMQPQMRVNLRGDLASGVAPYAGDYEAASGMANMLTDRMLALNEPVGGTLTFWTWFDIEEEWDYGFVEASTDGGVTWAPLPGTITRASVNPNQSTAWANSLLGTAGSTDAAITGSSGGWVQASFDLPAASDVLVRFSYYTDESTLGAGWFIDDVAVNGFADGFEGGSGNWSLGGWEVTTGLFSNDWIVAYSMPQFVSGRYTGLDYGFWDDGTLSAAYETIVGVLDTSQLNRQPATVVIANRPDESPFAASYRLLVRKAGVGQ